MNRDIGFAPRSRHRTLSRALRDPVFISSGGVAAAFLLAGLLAPLLAPSDYTRMDLLASFEPPLSPGHILGTDHLGRDLLTRVLYGIRTSTYVGGVVTAVPVLIGMVVGLLAGYYGRRLDFVLSSLMDVAWGFPIVLVAVMTVAIRGPGIDSILIGVSVVNWAGFARVIRADVLALRQKEFIEATRAVGLRDRRILMRHILPNMLASTLILASFYMGVVIIAEASLSFIGLGAQPPLPSLGQMVEEGRNYLVQDVWLALIPGSILAVAVLAFNMLGDALRDLLDPRLQV